MTVKALVTGVATAALVAAAAGGVTSIASSTSAAPAVAPVVFGVPMPEAPAPELQGALVQTLNGLVAPGTFAYKKVYIDGGLGRIETIGADSKFKQKTAEGYFPMTFVITDIDSEGPVATANVTATAATGATASSPLTFVAGPSPSGWLLSRDSVNMLLSSLS